MSVFGILAWMAAWAIAAITLVAGAAGLLSGAFSSPSVPTVVVATAAAFLARDWFLQRLLLASRR